MYQIDREKSGRFIAQLRREQGLTQKELAEKLFISDKAVSKWETGVSIPDTSLLVPLSKILGISVTELLLCERGADSTDMDDDELIKKALSYAESSSERAYALKSKWKLIFPVAAVIGGIGLIIGMSTGASAYTVYTLFLLSLIFGLYFIFFVQTKLPKYYDENKISGVFDSPFRMNIPGLSFNNSNWPHIVDCGRVWTCAASCLYPWLNTLMSRFLPQVWSKYELYAALILTMGGLFVPMYIVGKKYE